MTCNPHDPPELLSEFVALIDACATAAGGPNWPTQAALGLLVLLVPVALLLAGYVMTREHGA